MNSLIYTHWLTQIDKPLVISNRTINCFSAMWNWGGSGCEYQTSDWCWTEQEGITQSRPEIKREHSLWRRLCFGVLRWEVQTKAGFDTDNLMFSKWFHPTNKSKRSWQNWKKDIPGVRVPPVYWAAFTCCASCWWSCCFQCSQTAYRHPAALQERTNPWSFNNTN